jgi:hypothetical protein
MKTGRVWPELYKIALFESDANKVPDRIAAAETALVRRARELFHSAQDNIEEEHARALEMMRCMVARPSERVGV